jgi:hypothetical protein
MAIFYDVTGAMVRELEKRIKARLRESHSIMLQRGGGSYKIEACDVVQNYLNVFADLGESFSETCLRRSDKIVDETLKEVIYESA